MHIEYDFYQHKMTYKGDVDRGIMPFLAFFMCAEILSIRKKQIRNMRSIMINNTEHKIS